MSDEKYRLKIIQDSFDDSPREWDNLGTFVGWHRRYSIGDSQPDMDPEEYRESLPEDEIVLNVYMIEHSGVAYSTSPFGCPWDSGQVGYIHCSRERALSEGIDPGAVEAILADEIRMYSQWAEGDVYAFLLEKWEPATCGDPNHGEWAHSESCGGFYGSDWAENGMIEHLPEGTEHLLEGIEVSY